MKVTLSLFLLAILLVAVIADSSSSEEKKQQKKGKNKNKYPKDRIKADNDVKPFDFDREENMVTHHIHHYRPGFPGRPMFRPHGPHRRPPHRRPRPPRPDFYPHPDQQGEQQQPIINDLGELGDYLDGDNGAVGGRRPLPGITKPTLVLIKPNGQIVALPQKLLQLLKPQKEQQQQQQQQKPSIVPDSNAEVSEINKIPEGGHVADIDADINLTGQIGVTTGTTSTGEANTPI